MVWISVIPVRPFRSSIPYEITFSVFPHTHHLCATIQNKEIVAHLQFICTPSPNSCTGITLFQFNIGYVINHAFVLAGLGRDETDASSVRSAFSAKSQCGVFYYEIEIVSKGRDGYISIGYCEEETPLDKLSGNFIHTITIITTRKIFILTFCQQVWIRLVMDIMPMMENATMVQTLVQPMAHHSLLAMLLDVE
jgi:hypothetical protein